MLPLLLDRGLLLFDSLLDEGAEGVGCMDSLALFVFLLSEESLRDSFGELMQAIKPDLRELGILLISLFKLSVLRCSSSD